MEYYNKCRCARCPLRIMYIIYKGFWGLSKRTAVLFFFISSFLKNILFFLNLPKIGTEKTVKNIAMTSIIKIPKASFFINLGYRTNLIINVPSMPDIKIKEFNRFPVDGEILLYYILRNGRTARIRL